MKFRLFLLLLSIVLVAACKKAGSESQSVGRENEVIQEDEASSAFPAAQAVATFTATARPATTTQAVAAYTATPEPTLTPSNTPRPLNTPRPSWTPTATPTWWGLLPATPVNDVTLTPLPSPSFEQDSTPVYVGDTAMFDSDRQAKWLEALSPLPYLEFPISLDTDADSDETMTVTMEFKPAELIEINLDQDEALEIALAYLLVPPSYSEETFPLTDYEDYTRQIRFYYGDAYIAIFDDDGELLEKSEAAPLEFLTTIELSSVNLSTNLKGVFFSLDGLGTSMWQSSTTKILYIWQNSELEVAWRREKERINAAGPMRFLHRTEAWDRSSFQDVDGDGFEELLFAHGVYNLQGEGSCCFLHYSLFYPGALVYKWHDDGSSSAYLLAEDGLQPIRPQSPTTLGTFVDRPIVVDGDLLDWRQIEYVNYLHDLTYDDCTLPGRVRFAWDDENLYISFLLLPEEEVVLALDTDFETDFGTTISDMDDVFLTVSVDEAEALDLSFESDMNGSDPAVASAIGEPTYINLYSYPVEISIPLDELGLDEIILTAPVGWGIIDEPSSHPHGYYLSAQAAAGFAVQTNQDSVWPVCFELNEAITTETAVLDMTNPTTWGTLVFTADRGTPTN
jgi:hypothetical protein